jgi:hypothetical protein
VENEKNTGNALINRAISGGQAAVEALRLLVEGVTDDDALDDLSRKFSEAEARAGLDAAVERFCLAAACDRTVVIGWALEAYRETYRRALEADQFGEALRAVKELVALADVTKELAAKQDEAVSVWSPKTEATDGTGKKVSRRSKRRRVGRRKSS